MNKTRIMMWVTGAFVVHALSTACTGSSTPFAHAGSGVGGLDPSGGTGGGSCTCAAPVLTATTVMCNTKGLATLELPGRPMVDILTNVRVMIPYTDNLQPPAPIPPLLNAGWVAFAVGEGVISVPCSGNSSFVIYH